MSTTRTSGAWRPEEPAAFRHFLDLGTLHLDSGERLPGARLAWESWGTLAPEHSNAVLILHALTGDAHVHGPAAPGQATEGWWNGIVGPGCALDPAQWYIVAVNVLGGCQGSTGPASPAPDGADWGSRFPLLSTRDQVRAEAALADHLGITRWALVLGASLGGHRALEWAITYPERVERLIVIASGASTTAEQAAWAHTQIGAIELDPNWHGGDYRIHNTAPTAGLALARRIAHTTYRSPRELDTRFGRATQDSIPAHEGGRLAVQSYLDHHGDKLVGRFDAGSYVTLCRALLSHDVGRGRGGIAEALGLVRARTLAVAVDSDRLFLPDQVWQIAEHVPGALYREIHSLHGHDGFLIETAQVSTIVRDFLENTGARHSATSATKLSACPA